MMSTDNGDPKTKEPYKTTFLQKILKDKNVFQTFSDHRKPWQPTVWCKLLNVSTLNSILA
jgi:hypothetical protein